MATLKTSLRLDSTFYPSAKAAMQAASENLAYISLLNPASDGTTDALAVADVDPGSSTYGQIVYETGTRRDEEAVRFAYSTSGPRTLRH
jgi:hypothetical protein